MEDRVWRVGVWNEDTASDDRYTFHKTSESAARELLEQARLAAGTEAQDPEVAADLIEFQKLLSQGNLDAAVDLFNDSDPLSGGSDAYALSIDIERLRD